MSCPLFFLLRHRVNGVGRGGGQTVFLTRFYPGFHGENPVTVRLRSGQNPLESCVSEVQGVPRRG